ncbi:MAG: MarR family winged helix-turn-helix transcriptional regulator [Nitriliruptoraceae bacterium]
MAHDPAALPVVDRVPSPQLEAWRAFLEAYAVTLDVLERELKAGAELPLTWYDVLVQLAEAPDNRLRMQDLADAVLLSKSGVTRLVDRMERSGLVERTRCAHDRRGTFAALTPSGRERLRGAAPTHLAGVQAHFAAHLDDEEAAMLVRLLSRIAEANRAARER